MKPTHHPKSHGPAHKRPRRASAAIQGIQAAEVKRRRDQAAMRWAVVLGLVAIGAVFVGLEVIKPAREVTQAELASEEAAKSAAAQPEAPVEVLPERSEPAPTDPRDAAAAAGEAAAPDAAELAAVEPTEAERLAKEADMVLVGIEATRETAHVRDHDLLVRACNGKAWDAYRALVGRSVKAGIAKLAPGQGVNRFDPVWKEPSLYQAFLRWKTLGCFSESEITAVVSDSYTGEMLQWLLHDNAAMEELLLTMDPADDGGKVLKFLTDTWTGKEEEKKFRKFFSLAVACAVVFDRTIGIDHPLGADTTVSAVVEPRQRFNWFVEKDEKGKLAAPVHRSSARDLVWVVCAPVATSELEWSLDKLRYRRKNWGDAYGSITYLMERAVEGLDPYEEYSFAEILKEGGICGDQSYFCVNTARAQGIPAMTIAGETSGGGHAWAGVKIDDDEWTTGVGRIGGASKGTAGNPQTGAAITEQEIQLWNDRAHTSPITTLSVFRHLWLGEFFLALNSPADNATTVHLANQIGHSFTETWKALYALLERQTQMTGDPEAPGNLEEWKDFAKDMRREYKENPRMAELAATAEMEYIFPYGKEGDAKRSLLRERRRLVRDAGEQADLVADSLKRQAEVIQKRGGLDTKRDISRLYDRALRDYGGSITGFKMMSADYFGYLKDDPELARKAARDIELAFKRVVETDNKDWFRAKTESGIYRTICGYYRSAGDTDRAEMLEKRIDVMMRRATRDAL